MDTKSEPSLWDKFQQFFGMKPSKTSENPVDPITPEIHGGLVAMFGGGSITGGNEIANILGGCECNTSVLGGYDQLQSYGDSVYSKQKEKLIRDIASDVFTALKLKGSKFAETAPISDVVTHLKKVTPHPRDRPFNKTFKSSAHNQKEVCHALANAINNRYGSNMVPMTLTEEGMCDRIAEVMYSLFVGLHTEFMTVAGDVVRIVKNLEALKKLIASSYQKQVELVKSTGEVNAMNQSAETEKLYKALNSELDRQLAILGNMINVAVGPTGTSLINLLTENKDFAGVVKEIKGEIGTDKFGDKLAQLLTGISSIAYSAELIEKALKTLGMSVKDFKDSDSARDFRTEVFKHIQDSSPTSDELDKMMAAAEVIYKNDYSRNELMKYLDGHVASKGKKHKAKGGDVMFGGFDVEGGADSDDEMPLYWSKKSLDSKLKKKGEFRKLMLGEFRKMLQADFRKLIQATNSLISKVGNELDANDELDIFIQVFKNLPTLNEEGLTIVLSGYPRDGVSKGKKENFLNHYHSLIYVLEPLTKGKHGNLFLEVRSATNDVIKTIDDFSDKIVKAITEIHIDRPNEIREAIKKTSTMFFGSGEGTSAHSLRQSFAEFDKVKNSLIYFYNIRNIRHNLSVVANEMTTFTEDYENMLGEEAAFIINSINKHYANNLQQPTNAILKEHMNAERVSKVRMVEAAQAVDLYLKAFSNNIAKNPDVVHNIVTMLEQVDMVAKWFTEKSGDNLACVMEWFPARDGTQKIATSTISPASFKGHYLEWVDKLNGNVGNPLNLRTLSDNDKDKYENLIDLLRKSVKGMRALENILSVFSSIGNTFGDLDLKSKTFMTPGQIFNTLCDYVIMSAVSYEGVKDPSCKFSLSSIPDSESKEYKDYFSYHDLSNEELNYKLNLIRSNEKKENITQYDRFAGTDSLFHMTIKSIVCKVFTCVDAYKLFNRYSMKSSGFNSLNPVRTILGGAEDFVKVNKENVELYLRLPLLAEWYREKFGFRNQAENKNDIWQLSIVPNIDGIWSGLMQIIFEDTEYIKEGNYSESQVKTLIREIDSISSHYKAKYKDATVRKILNSFVVEMNRIIGFIQQKHINSYLKQKDQYLNGVNDKEDDFLDYDILDSEDGSKRNPAPSDKFVSTGIIKKLKNKKMQMFYEKINKIRTSMDNEFMRYTKNGDDLKEFNFAMAVRNYKSTIESSPSERDAYKVVLSMIQGSNNLINKNSDMLIMLHETVIVPLNVLWGIWATLIKFLVRVYGSSGKLIETEGNTSYEIMSTFIENNFPLLPPNMYSLMYKEANTFLPAEIDAEIPNNKNTIKNPNLLIKNLLTAILDIGCDPNKLVSFDISDTGHVNFSWDKLENLCKNLLENVRLNIKKLSVYFNSINSNFMEKDSNFDDYTILKEFSNPNMNFNHLRDDSLPTNHFNSVAFIQRELIDQIFNNIYKYGLVNVRTHIESTFKAIAKTDLSFENGVASHILYERFLLNPTYYRDYSRYTDKKIDNNLTSFPFNILPVIDNELKDDRFNKFLNTLKFNTRDNEISNDLITMYSKRLIVPRFYGMTKYDSDNRDNRYWHNSKSLMNVFNSTLFQFLEQMSDPKIYINLIRDYINTEAYDALTKGNCFPNIGSLNETGDGVLEFMETHSPKNTVLYASNAQILSSLYNSIHNRTNEKKYLYNNLNDIQNSYLLEVMRCNLPYFMKIFQIIYNRAYLLSNLLEKTSLNKVLRPETSEFKGKPIVEEKKQEQKLGGAEDVFPPEINTIKQVGFVTIVSRGDSSIYFNKILKILMRSCDTLIKSCTRVYKELQDTNPYFLELSKDFIEDFKSKNSTIPLMPVSMALAPSRKFENRLLLPNSNLTSDEFKFNYGSRLLLARSDIQPKLDHVPSAKVVYNNYVLSNKNTTTISMKEYEDTMLNLINLIRWINDGRVYNPLFSFEENKNNKRNVKFSPLEEAKVLITKDEVHPDLLQNALHSIRHIADEDNLVNMLLENVEEKELEEKELEEKVAVPRLDEDAEFDIILGDDILWNRDRIEGETIADYDIRLGIVNQFRNIMTLAFNMNLHECLNLLIRLFASFVVIDPEMRYPSIIHLYRQNIDNVTQIEAQIAFVGICRYLHMHLDIFVELDIARALRILCEIDTSHNITVDVANALTASTGINLVVGDVFPFWVHIIKSCARSMTASITNDNSARLIGRIIIRDYNDANLNGRRGLLQMPLAPIPERIMPGGFLPNIIEPEELIQLIRYIEGSDNVDVAFPRAPALNAVWPAVAPARAPLPMIPVSGGNDVNMNNGNLDILGGTRIHNINNSISCFMWGGQFNLKSPYSSLPLAFGNIRSIIEIVDENNNNSAKLKLVKFININNRLSKDNDSRSKLRILNILDMNIVPFNIHALMKEVPFANLINYSYTFDRLIHDLILPEWFKYRDAGSNNDIIKPTHNVANTKESMVVTLLYPHATFNQNNIVNIRRIANGLNSTKLKVPSYINDQLFNKVILMPDLSNKTIIKADDKINKMNLIKDNKLEFLDTNVRNIYSNSLDRFNTKLFRNLFWFAQLQRVMKVSMTSYLSYVDSPVITGLDIADPIVTEFKDHQRYNENVFQGIREDLL